MYDSSDDWLLQAIVTYFYIRYKQFANLRRGLKKLLRLCNYFNCSVCVLQADIAYYNFDILF